MSEQLATPCKKFGHTGGRYKSRGCKECKNNWRLRYPDKARAASQAWRQRNPEKARERTWLTHAIRLGYPNPTRPRPQVCECCGGPPNGKGRLHLDHDHRTGKFRGWLCSRCNISLGGFGDSVEGLEKAIEYLTKTAGYDTLPETMAKAKGD